MDIGSVLGIQSTGNGTAGAVSGSGAMGRDEFLKLLLVQLQMQDPLEPMDNEEMIAQLAQFSSLEQMENMNTALEQSLEMDLLVGQLLNNTMSTTLIGKAVRAQTGSFSLPEDGSVSLGYRVGAAADTVSASIRDADGLEVVNIKGLDDGEGDHTFSWDGRDRNGNRLAPGTYSFVVTASDAEGNAVDVEEMIEGVVEGVRYQDGSARLMIGETEIFMNEVVEIYGELQG